MLIHTLTWLLCASCVYNIEILLKVFATPLGSMREMAADPKEEGKDQKKKKKAERSSKKLKSERFDKWESLSQRLRLCILKGRPKPS